MDPRKRTTIIVLLFLTILLGVVSVVITTQIQRNNSAVTSFAGDLTVPVPTSEELYDPNTCDTLVEGLDLETVSEGTILANNLTCEYTDGSDNTYQIKVIKNNYISIADIQDTLEEGVVILQQYSSEYERGDVYSMYGSLEDECIGYAVSEAVDDSYLSITFGSEEACDTSTNVETFGEFVNDLSFKIYDYFTK